LDVDNVLDEIMGDGEAKDIFEVVDGEPEDPLAK